MSYIANNNQTDNTDNTDTNIYNSSKVTSDNSFGQDGSGKASLVREVYYEKTTSGKLSLDSIINELGTSNIYDKYKNKHNVGRNGFFMLINTFVSGTNLGLKVALCVLVLVFLFFGVSGLTHEVFTSLFQ